MYDFLAAADEHVSEVAHGSAPEYAEAGCPFGPASAIGNVSSARASSAVCSSARRGEQ